MPVFVPAVRLGNALVPRSIPGDVIGLDVIGSNYVYSTIDDLFAPDIDVRLGSNVLSAAIPVHRRFAGMHYHTQVPPITHGLVRNIDSQGCHWSDIEPQAGVFRWAFLDALVAAAAANGRDVVYCLLSTPTWASARPSEPGHYTNGGDAEPADMATIGKFAAAVCSRYRALGTPIAAFEVWNEPKYAGGGGVDHGNYFTGAPGALAQMARSIYVAVKSVDPAVLVLSPSPTGLEYPWVAGDGTGTDHLDEFLGAPDSAGGSGRDWVDVIAFHSYSHDGTNNVFAIPQMVDNVRRCIALHSLAGRELWITETSAITPPLASYVSRRQQEFIARTMLLALGAGVSRVIWYAWDDPLGFDQQPTVAAWWNGFIGSLSGSTLSLVNSLASRQVAAIVGGIRQIV
jgi:hypothetical protein